MKVKKERYTKSRMLKAGLKPVRKTNAKGKRVWMLNGKEYATLAEIANTYKVSR